MICHCYHSRILHSISSNALAAWRVFWNICFQSFPVPNMQSPALLLCRGCIQIVQGGMEGNLERVGHSDISTPAAFITILMTYFACCMLGARLQGVHLKRLQEPATCHQCASIAGATRNPSPSKKKNWIDERKKQSPSDNAFHGSVALQGFLLHGPEMGKLIVALEQIGITPLDALMSRCRPDSLTGWG